MHFPRTLALEKGNGDRKDTFMTFPKSKMKVEEMDYCCSHSDLLK